MTLGETANHTIKQRGPEKYFACRTIVNGIAMQPGEDPFQFIMEIDRLVADLHRLGGKSVTEVRKCVIIVVGLSADYEIEVCMLKNNLTGLERAEIERVVGKQHNRPLRQQQNSKALSPSRSTNTVGCSEEKQRSCDQFKGNCFNYGRKGHRAEDCRSAKKNIEKSEDAAADKKGRYMGKCYVCGSKDYFTHKHWLVQKPGASDSRLRGARSWKGCDAG